MLKVLERFWNRLFEPVVGILGGTFTASEVTHSHISFADFFSNVFCIENIGYLIIGTIGAFLFGVAAYMARKLCDKIFKKTDTPSVAGATSPPKRGENPPTHRSEIK